MNVIKEKRGKRFWLNMLRWIVILIVLVCVLGFFYFFWRTVKPALIEEKSYCSLMQDEEQLKNTITQLSFRLDRIENDQKQINQYFNLSKSIAFSRKTLELSHSAKDNLLIFFYVLQNQVNIGKPFGLILSHFSNNIPEVQELQLYSSGITPRFRLIQLLENDRPKKIVPTGFFWSRLWWDICHIITIENNQARNINEMIIALRKHDDCRAQMLLKDFPKSDVQKKIAIFFRVHHLLDLLEESLTRLES